jgi:hypothetical protein
MSAEVGESASYLTVIAEPSEIPSSCAGSIDWVIVVWNGSPPSAGLIETSNLVSWPPPMSVFPVGVIEWTTP